MGLYEQRLQHPEQGQTSQSSTWTLALKAEVKHIDPDAPPGRRPQTRRPAELTCCTMMTLPGTVGLVNITHHLRVTAALLQLRGNAVCSKSLPTPPPEGFL